MKKNMMMLGMSCLLAVTPLAAQQTLNLRDADIRAFIQDAARVTGRTFIIDQRVQGKVSVVTDRPLSRSEYFEVFLSTLRANGLVAVPAAGGAFRIQPLDTAASQPSRVGTGASSRNSFVTEVLRLRSIDAASALETIRPLVSREGSVTANRNGNSIVVADFADNIRRIREVLRQVDRDNAATEIIALKNAGAREIATALSALVPAPAAGGGEGSVATGAPATIVPIDSSNSIALRGDPGTVARLADVARELDRRAASGTEIRVVWLDYANAEQLVPVLQTLVGQAPSAASVTPGNGPASGRSGGDSAVPAPVAAVAAGSGVQGRGQAVITRYENANAIIIAANPETQRLIGEVIRQLDLRQEQVLVEAIIVEVSDNVARELGVQWLVGGKDIPFAVTNFSNVTPNIISLAGGLLADELDQTTTVINGDVVTTSTNSAVSDLLRENAARAILGARGGFGGFTADIGNNRVLGALINAVQADSNSNILSTPSLTVNNNVQGSILFGQEIPVSTGEALSNNFDNAFRTIQRQNVGIELEVTPQINAGNEIRLELRQQVSSIVGPVSNDFNELIINKREIKTTVTVRDREIVALGGLLDDNERRTIEKIPLLGDIPLIGELFKSRARSRVKTNLMVFIRPTILRTSEDARALASRRYGYVRDTQLRRNPDQEPAIDELVRDYLGTSIPLPKIAPDAPPPVVIAPDGQPPASTIQPVEIPPSEVKP